MSDALLEALMPQQALLSPELVSLLQALNVAEINFDLNGSGDSGEASLGTVLDRDGRNVVGLPDLPIGIKAGGHVAKLAAHLEDLAADLPEGDWVNNEGGYGTVTILPFAADPDELASCDMTYRDEYEDENDWEGEEDIEAFDIDPPGQGQEPAPVNVIIQGEIQP